MNFSEIIPVAVVQIVEVVAVGFCPGNAPIITAKYLCPNDW